MNIWPSSDILRSWLEAFAAQSVYAAIAALLVWVTVKLWRPKHPVWHVALWSLVLVRFILPVDLASPWTARTLVEQTSANWIMRDFAGLQEQQRPLFESEKPSAAPPAFDARSARPDASLSPAASADNPVDWIVLLFCFWLLGAGLLLTRLLRAYAHLTQLISRATPITSEPLTRMVDQWRVNLGVRRPVALLSSTACTGAFTCHVFKPVIVLPTSLVSRMDDADLSAILGHEIAHIRGLDSFWLLLEQVLRALFFFHPAIWIATTKLDEAREALRDLDMLKAGSVSANAYAVTLLTVLKSQHENAQTPLLAVAMGKTAQRLKDRLMLLKIARAVKYPSRWLIAVSTVAIAALVLPMAQSVAKKPKAAVPQKAETALAPPKAVSQNTAELKTDILPQETREIADALQDADDPVMAASDPDITPPPSVVVSVADVAPLAAIGPIESAHMTEALADLADVERDARQEIAEAVQAVVEARVELRSAGADDRAAATENLLSALRELVQVKQQSLQMQQEAAAARRTLHLNFQRTIKQAQQDAAQALRDAEQARRDAAQAMREVEQARHKAELEWHAAFLQAKNASYHFFTPDTDISTMVVIDKDEVRCGANVKAGTAHKIIINGRNMTCNGPLTRADLMGGLSADQKAVGILGQKGVISVERKNGKTISVQVRSSNGGPLPSVTPVPPVPGSGASTTPKRIKADIAGKGCEEASEPQIIRTDFLPAQIYSEETAAFVSGSNIVALPARIADETERKES